MTLTSFVKQNQGKKIDYDGAYGSQCVDLYRQYCRDVLEIEQTPGVDGASEIFEKCGSLKQIPESTKADYSQGDVLIWGPTEKNKYGHVAILVSVYNAFNFIVFEQNGFTQDGAKLVMRSREGLIGGLYK